MRWFSGIVTAHVHDVRPTEAFERAPDRYGTHNFSLFISQCHYWIHLRSAARRKPARQ